MNEDQTPVSVALAQDGPPLGVNPSRSFAAAAFNPYGMLLEVFAASFPGHASGFQPPTTFQWAPHLGPLTWGEIGQPGPAAVMRVFRRWLEGLPGQPIFVASLGGSESSGSQPPVFLSWYLNLFAEEGFRPPAVVDCQAVAMGLLGRDYLGSGEGQWPEEWFKVVGQPLTPPELGQVGLDQLVGAAIGQGRAFCAMGTEAELLRSRRPPAERARPE